MLMKQFDIIGTAYVGCTKWVSGFYSRCWRSLRDEWHPVCACSRATVLHPYSMECYQWQKGGSCITFQAFQALSVTPGCCSPRRNTNNAPTEDYSLCLVDRLWSGSLWATTNRSSDHRGPVQLRHMQPAFEQRKPALLNHILLPWQRQIASRKCGQYYHNASLLGSFMPSSLLTRRSTVLLLTLPLHGQLSSWEILHK